MPDQPGDLPGIKKNAKLAAALLMYMKKEHNDENFMFYFDKGNPEAIYKKYIAKGAKQEVNLPSKVSGPCYKLGDAADWDNKAWSKLLTDAKSEINGLCIRDVIPRFYKSTEYENFCKSERMGDPTKAAKLLGIKNVKLLTQAMTAAVTGEKRESIVLFGKLAKEEKLQENAEAIYKALTKAGLI